MTSTPVVSDRAQIYTAMLRRYLTTSSDNSFPERFPVAFVVVTARSDAAKPTPEGSAVTEPISDADQAAILEALRDVGRVEFVATFESVVEGEKPSCPRVRDGGIVVTLGTIPAGTPDRQEIGIFGFVACLGATWLTYVVERVPSGWAVMGTTGSRAIA